VNARGTEDCRPLERPDGVDLRMIESDTISGNCSRLVVDSTADIRVRPRKVTRYCTKG
jgi:hypothetical protein